MSTTIKFLSCAALLALGVQGAMAKPVKDGWFKVTQSFVICVANCHDAKVGDVFLYVSEAQGDLCCGWTRLVQVDCPSEATLILVKKADWRRRFKPVPTPKQFYHVDRCR